MWQPGATEEEIRLQFINIMVSQFHWLCRRDIKKPNIKGLRRGRGETG